MDKKHRPLVRHVVRLAVVGIGAAGCSGGNEGSPTSTPGQDSGPTADVTFVEGGGDELSLDAPPDVGSDAAIDGSAEEVGTDSGSDAFDASIDADDSGGTVEPILNGPCSTPGAICDDPQDLAA